MRISVLLVTIAAIAALSVRAGAEDKPDPLRRVYTATPDAAFLIMGRAIAGKWIVTHSDKNLCLVSFEKKESLISSGVDATATCEPGTDGGTVVRIKARQKGAISLGGKERGFEQDVFKEFEKAGLK